MKENPSFKSKGKLTTARIKRLVFGGVRNAIKVRSKTGDVRQLKGDFSTIIKHTFGDCSSCSKDICRSVQGKESRPMDQEQNKDNDENSDGIRDEQHENVLADREENLLNILDKIIIEETSNKITEEEMKDREISKEPNNIYKELLHGLIEGIER